MGLILASILSLAASTFPFPPHWGTSDTPLACIHYSDSSRSSACHPNPILFAGKLYLNSFGEKKMSFSLSLLSNPHFSLWPRPSTPSHSRPIPGELDWGPIACWSQVSCWLHPPGPGFGLRQRLLSVCSMPGIALTSMGMSLHP